MLRLSLGLRCTVHIDWVVAARAAEIRDDGTIDITGAGIDTLLVLSNSLPIPCEFTLALRVAGPMDEWREANHELTITRIDPTGASRHSDNVALAAPDPPPMWERGMEAGLLLALRQRWQVDQFGLYTFDLAVDRRLARSIAIRLRTGG